MKVSPGLACRQACGLGQGRALLSHPAPMILANAQGGLGEEEICAMQALPILRSSSSRKPPGIYVLTLVTVSGWI